MKTIILDQPGTFRLTDTAAPQSPAAGEALVRVRRIGICGTDLHAFRGRQPFFTYPRILGHELGVEVLAIGESVTNVRDGDRAAVEPYLNCGSCIACRRGRTNCCGSLKVLGVHTDGGMRESILVPADKLHRSDKLTLEQLALIETLGIGAHAVERATLERDESVVIIGAGPIGLSVVQFAILEGVKILVLDTNSDRLAFCKATFANARVETALLPTDAGTNLRDFVKAQLTGELPTVVFDATGNAQSMNRAFDLPAPTGKLILVGLVQSELTFNDPDFHRRELTIYATRNSTPDTFRRIIALVEAGQVDTQPWITHRAPFDAMIEQFPRWLDPASRCVKAVVEV